MLRWRWLYRFDFVFVVGVVDGHAGAVLLPVAEFKFDKTRKRQLAVTGDEVLGQRFDSAEHGYSGAVDAVDLDWCFDFRIDLRELGWKLVARF